MPLAFYHVLANNLVANVTNFTVWFGITFWIFLETQSVFATGMIAGMYLVFTAAFGFWFGSLVDHHSKRAAMLGSSVASFGLYAVALGLLLAAPAGAMRNVASPWLWSFALLVMLGVIAGNVRSIALPTLVTFMIPADRRDKANGLVGMVTGIGFLTTSVISGFLVAWSSMWGTLAFALACTALAFGHLLLLRVEETPPAAAGAAAEAAGAGAEAQSRRVDIAGTIRVIAAVPGLFALIFFATFNNFLGGVFMALLDAYGLSLVAVEVWGLTFAALSVAFIASGMVIARTGLGSNPLRTLMVVNLIVWPVCILFTIQSWFWLLVLGCGIWMFCGPWIEAAEHTLLQKVVPRERQGRVFGFAQSVEQSVSPLTAFVIGPLTQYVFIPFMTTGTGAELIGGWFGTGPERGMALVFTLAGLAGLAVTILAFNSRYYRELSAAYLRTPDDDQPGGAAPAASAA